MPRLIRISAIIYFFLFFVGSLWAQSGSSADFQMEWGPELPMNGEYWPIGFVGDEEHGLIRITEVLKKEIAFERLGKDLKPIGELKREWLPPSPNVMVEQVLEMDGKTFILVSDYEPKAEAEKLLLYEVDDINGGFRVAAREIIRTAGKVRGRMVFTGSIRYSVTDKFKVEVQPDGEHIVVYTWPKRQVKTELESDALREYYLLDRNWNVLWSREVTLSNPVLGIKSFMHRVVNNEILLFAGMRADRKSEGGYDRVSVFRISKNSEAVEHLLQIEGGLVQDIAPIETQGKYLFLAGYTGPNAYSPYCTGFFTARYDMETFESDNVSFHPFDEKMMSGSILGAFADILNISDVSESQRRGIPYLGVKKVLPRPGGGWFVISEQAKRYSETVQNSNGTGIRQHQAYGDIWVTGLDAQMGSLFSHRIPKKQHFQYSGNMLDFFTIDSAMGSFSAYRYQNDLYLFYVDLMENRGLENSNLARELHGTKGAALLCERISPEGNVDHIVVHEIDLRDQRKLMVPKQMKELEPGVWFNTSMRYRASLYPSVLRLTQ